MKMYMMMAMIGGLGVAGFMYLKKHPEIMNKMMDIKKDAMNSIDNMMDE